ncbi:uncharacterized protein LOC130666788 [Microplitis mediator]|uniref:uncharacterized protein LOC130666788 n=1 Tax=Microplitis mediator TaxID=375433 RepID=UPI0025570FFC|nr:uncharacterized protein LOC130666788 [Microplitis mediator]
MCHVIKKIKQRARKSEDKPVKLISNQLKNVDLPVIARIPSMNTISRTVQRCRRQNNPDIANPVTRADIVLSNVLCTTHNEEQFLLHDSGGGDKRYLMFGTKKNLQFLASCEEWFSDGTFKTVPTLFNQLYTIHGMKNGKTLPLVYILTPRKSKSIYKQFLTVLKNKLEDVRATRMMVDFERSYINAFTECFPKIDIAGCYFHMTQCVWRKIQHYGLQKNYNTDIKFARNVRMLFSLAFVPVNDITDAYEELVASDCYDLHSEELNNLVEYFEKTWIGKKNCIGKRSEPLFAIKMWNCYSAVIEDFARTNNVCEGWHNGFNGRIQMCHAKIDKFIMGLKSEQTITDVTMTQINTGLDVNRKTRAIYRDYNLRLKAIVLNYDSTKKMEFLRNVSSLIIIN